MKLRNSTVTATLWIVALVPAPALGQQVTFTSVTDTIDVPGNTVIGSEMTIEARISVQPPLSGIVFNEQMFAQEDKLLWFTATELHGGAYRGPAAATTLYEEESLMVEWLRESIASLNGEGD